MQPLQLTKILIYFLIIDSKFLNGDSSKLFVTEVNNNSSPAANCL